MSTVHRKFLTVGQVAEMYSVSSDKVYRDIRKGFLPAVAVGQSVRIRESDALGYAQELNTKAVFFGMNDTHA